MSWIDKRQEQRVFAEANQIVNQRKKKNPADALVAQRLADIYRRHPYIPTGTALSLAEAGADMATVDNVALRATTTKYEKLTNEAQQPTVPDPRQSRDPEVMKQVNKGSWWSIGWDDVADATKFVAGNTLGRIAPLKSAVRQITSIASSGPQLVAAIGSKYTDPEFSVATDVGFTMKEANQIAETTSSGQLWKNPELQGDGFVISRELEEKRVEAVRKHRWQLSNGDYYTVGRGTANMFTTPGSFWYDVISGSIDAAITYWADPTNKPVDKLFKGIQAGKVIPGLDNLDEASAARKLAQNQAGLLSPTEQAAIDTSRFFGWLDNSRQGRRMVRRTAEETNELKILEAYNYKISPQKARELARAGTEDEVRGILGEAAMRLSDETERGMVPFARTAEGLPITGATYDVVQKIPGYAAIKNNRWLSKVPTSSLMVNGTPQQKAEGLKNMANWLRLIGVDPYDGQGQKLMEAAFDWAGADGTRTDANKMLRLFLGDKKAGTDGLLTLALRNADVDDATIAKMDEVFRDNERLLRTYSFNAAGQADDHGLMVYLTQFMDDVELDDVLHRLYSYKYTRGGSRAQMDSFVRSLQPGELTVFGPTTLSQVLNNTVILPDPQAIRKLMTNPFYIRGKSGMQNRVTRIAEEIQNEIWRPWALATVGFVMRNGFDAQTRIAMSGIVNNNPLDYLLIAARRRGAGTVTGQTWRSAEEIPNSILLKVARTQDPDKIVKLLDEYYPVDFPLPDSIVDDLIDAGFETTVVSGISKTLKKDRATALQEVRDIIGRSRPMLEELDEYVDFTRSQSKYMVEDPRHQLAKLIEDGQVVTVDTSSATYAKGLLDQAGQINADPFLSFAARLMHLPVDRQIEAVVKWLAKDTTETRRARNTLIDIVSNPLVGDNLNGRNKVMASVVDATNMTDDELVEAVYRTNNLAQVELFVQNNDELRALVGYNSVPVGQSQIVDEATATRFHVGAGKPKPGDILVETTVLPNGQQTQKTYLILERSKPKGATSNTYKIIQVEDAYTALKREPGRTIVSPRAQRFAENLQERNRQAIRSGLNPVAPPEVAMRVETPAMRGNGKVFRGGETLTDAATFLPRLFFRSVVDPVAKTLERSPAFRRIYYNIIRENVDLLEPDEVLKLIDNIDKAAQRAFPKAYAKNPKKAIIHYVGGKDVYDAIENAGMNRTGLGGTVEQLQDYALTTAKLDAEEIFFNNVSRSNFTDAMRVVAPFGAAWAEIAGTYAKAIVRNPSRASKALMVYRGAEQYDPENDGRGFFWTDPQTGQQMFTFPLSGYAIKGLTALTGQSVEGSVLTAPTKRLSAGFSLIPSLGPVFSIAATEWFNRQNEPDMDAFRKFILPYGDANVGDLVPGSVAKFLEAVKTGVTDLTTMRGNVKQDIFAYLMSTGEYDATDPEDVTRAEQDADAASSGMMMIRAISQFVGPTAGTPQYRYKKEAGEYYWTNEMVKAFSDLQNEDYDSAVAEFIKRFGMNAMIYVSGKTRVSEEYRGVEATEEYGKWERENDDLIKAFKKTAPFLAPGSFGDFSMEVYSRQLAAGMRKDRDNRDRLADAQRRVGSALYKHIRNQFPETLTDAQREELKRYREAIHKKHPGFPKVAEFTAGEFDNFVNDLGRLLQDPRVKGNKVAESTREYLKYRANMIAKLKSQEGVSIRAQKNPGAVAVRGMLYARGESLAEQNPDFRRIWDQELASEVEGTANLED